MQFEQDEKENLKQSHSADLTVCGDEILLVVMQIYFNGENLETHEVFTVTAEL